MDFDRETTNVQAFTNELVKIINTNTRRIRVLEQRMDAMEMRMGGMEEKIINEIEGIRKDFEEFNADIKNIVKNIGELKNENLRINKTIDKTARKSEVKELESLLDLYSPIKSKFTTRDEVERLIEDKLSKKT